MRVALLIIYGIVAALEMTNATVVKNNEFMNYIGNLLLIFYFWR